MKVFISWSGDLSNRVATVLKNWIPNVLDSVELFVSSEDIESGSRWSEEIAHQLSFCDYGILCITKDNTREPWINFEAGALSNKLGASKVCPFLYEIDVSEIAEPLKQFQAVTFTRKDVLKLIHSVNNSCGNNKLDSVRLELLFGAFWDSLLKSITEIRSDMSINTKDNDYTKIPNITEVQDIEDRLELFYIPAQHAIMIADKFMNNSQNLDVWHEICKHKRGYEHQDMTLFERASIYVAEDLKQITKYRFRAKEDTRKAFDKFVYGEESEENYSELSRLINRDIEDYQGKLNGL
jgi:TIR domain